MKQRAEDNEGRLPPFVQTLGSKVVHINWDMTSCTPPLAWRTLCGWHYHKSDYVFTTKAAGGDRCKKCLDIAQLQKR